MLTAVLTFLVFAAAQFGERLVTAILILLLARWCLRQLRKLKARATAACIPLVANMSHTLAWLRIRLAMIIGPTVTL